MKRRYVNAHVDHLQQMLWCRSMQKQALVQVWAVTVTPEGMALTGSADKTIRMWQANGMCVQTFVGHTDCVRAIKILPDIGFVSAGQVQ
jgi:phospholipase A-2-activating protein